MSPPSLRLALTAALMVAVRAYQIGVYMVNPTSCTGQACCAGAPVGGATAFADSCSNNFITQGSANMLGGYFAVTSGAGTSSVIVTDFGEATGTCSGTPAITTSGLALGICTLLINAGPTTAYYLMILDPTVNGLVTSTTPAASWINYGADANCMVPVNDNVMTNGCAPGNGVMVGGPTFTGSASLSVTTVGSVSTATVKTYSAAGCAAGSLISSEPIPMTGECTQTSFGRVKFSPLGVFPPPPAGKSGAAAVAAGASALAAAVLTAAAAVAVA